jgi:hypothetical protein
MSRAAIDSAERSPCCGELDAETNDLRATAETAKNEHRQRYGTECA